MIQSWTTIESARTTHDHFETDDRLEHPAHRHTSGAILREDYLPGLSLSAAQIAAQIRLPESTIAGILAETSAVTAETALRLARLFKTPPEFWLNLQTAHDLSKARLALQSTLESEILPIIPVPTLA